MALLLATLAASSRSVFAQASSLPPEIMERDWNLEAFQRTPDNSKDTIGAGVTIRFGAGGRVSGSGGCNRFFGSYTAGEGQALTISGVGATLKACEPAVNSFEQEYFAALQSVTSYTLDSPSRLRLTFNNGQGVLLYSSAAAEGTCFQQTGHCIRGRFLEFWERNGGLPVFGYPLSDEMTENGRSVQYFERQRFELHPENAAPYDVLLGRLGAELLERGAPAPTVPGEVAGCVYFAVTQHNVCDQPGNIGFLRYWRSHGLEFDGQRGTSAAESLALFGYPLSEAYDYTTSTGEQVVAQWFERARFEWHPNNPQPYRVLLGRLGAELLAAPPSGTPSGEGQGGAAALLAHDAASR